MPDYTCKRCLYCVKQKGTMRLHLARVNKCEVADNGQDIPTNVLLEELGDIRQRKRTFTCQFCDEGFAHLPGLSRHRKECVKRDIRTEQMINKLDIIIKLLSIPKTHS
jgi:hypothetical protein